jgi:hypothetical protein
MTCPYLKEVAVVFCRAYPVKKPVPVDQVTTASTCEGEFQGCALYREALARAERSASEDELHHHPAGPKGATP